MFSQVDASESVMTFICDGKSAYQQLMMSFFPFWIGHSSYQKTSRRAEFVWGRPNALRSRGEGVQSDGGTHSG
jgi:hypothetical protein